MGMLLRVTVTGKIQISLRLLRSPLLDLSRKCLLSRETLRPGGSIGVFTHHPLLYSPPAPRKPILPAVQRKVSWFYRSFTVVLSSIRDGYFRKWRDCTYTPFRLRRIQDRSKNFPMKFRPVMHSLWFQYNAEFISRIEKFILFARQIVFSSCALLSHNGNLTQIPTRENDARELSFPPVLIEK